MKFILTIILPIFALSSCAGKKTKIIYNDIPSADSIRITSTPIVATKAGEAYEYQLLATNNEGDVEWSIVSVPEGMELSSKGALTWLPKATDLGKHSVVVDAKDDQAIDRHSFIIQVGNTCVTGSEIALWLDVDNTEDISKSSYRGSLGAFAEVDGIPPSYVQSENPNRGAGVYLTENAEGLVRLHMYNRNGSVSTGTNTLDALLRVSNNSLTESLTVDSGSFISTSDLAYRVTLMADKSVSTLNLGEIGKGLFNISFVVEAQNSSFLSTLNFYSSPGKTYNMLVNEDDFSSFFVARREIQVCN